VSAAPGTDAPELPPGNALQLAVLFQFPLPATQNRSAPRVDVADIADIAAAEAHATAVTRNAHRRCCRAPRRMSPPASDVPAGRPLVFGNEPTM